MAAHSVLHVPFGYYPDAVGGTEVYVRDLAREQSARGYQVEIMAPADEFARYTHDGIPVTRFKVRGDVDDLADLYSSAKTDTTEFLNVVARFRPQVLHIHGAGRAVPPRALAQAKKSGAAIVLTYHTPTITCVQGTLLCMGTHGYDGTLDAQRCTSCILSARGVPAPLAAAIARTPASVGALLHAAGARGRMATALRMRELVALRHEDTRALLDIVDHIVAPAVWVVDLLQRIGVDRQRLTMSRQGISAQPIRPPRATERAALRLVYIGRLEPGKGIRLLTQALRQVPALPVELHIYGVVQGASHIAYHRELQNDAQRDRRIVMHGAIPSDDVVKTITDYDVLVVPSQQFETGPLVVLEAFAAGLPVVGTRLGGIAELVHEDVDGLLIAPGDMTAWAATCQRLIDDASIIDRLRTGVRPPRTMAAVADDMQIVYDHVARPS